MTEGERQARIYHHMYETCEGIAEQSERIVALEELVQDALAVIDDNCAKCVWQDKCSILADCQCAAKEGMRERMRELGVPL